MENKFIKADTHRGTYDENWDRFFVSVRERDLFAILADGVGGHSRGDVAAEMVIEKLKRLFFTAEDFPGKIPESVEDVSAKMRTVNRDMATTIVVAYLKKGEKKHKLFYTWAGDSRLFLISRNRKELQKGAEIKEEAGENMYILTEDDTIPWRYFSEKKINVDEITRYPGRSRLFFSIPRDGDKMRKRIESIDVEDGDILFLCSDGFWELFEKQSDLLDLVKIMALGRKGLFKNAVEEGMKYRERVDNSTFIMIKIEDGLFKTPYEKSFD